MDPTSERNLAVELYGPLMIEVMILPILEKSQIISYYLLAFLTPPPSSGHLPNFSLPFGQIYRPGQIFEIGQELNNISIILRF
jgi:hypothetical protein